MEIKVTFVIKTEDLTYAEELVEAILEEGFERGLGEADKQRIDWRFV